MFFAQGRWGPLLIGSPGFSQWIWVGMNCEVLVDDMKSRRVCTTLAFSNTCRVPGRSRLLETDRMPALTDVISLLLFHEHF